jgi:hypothetical protein
LQQMQTAITNPTILPISNNPTAPPLPSPLPSVAPAAAPAGGMLTAPPLPSPLPSVPPPAAPAAVPAPSEATAQPQKGGYRRQTRNRQKGKGQTRKK